MKNSIKFLAIIFFLATISCKKKIPAPDPYAFLTGTWQYANGAECMFDVATKTAKGTKVPTNNIQFKFVVGEDYWRKVLSTGTDKWEYEQIVRFSDGKTVEYRKSTMAKKDENTLTINTQGLTDSELKRK
jgi:hypothetical protein